MHTDQLIHYDNDKILKVGFNFGLAINLALTSHSVLLSKKYKSTTWGCLCLLLNILLQIHFDINIL
jgi:hypothetical protein